MVFFCNQLEFSLTIDFLLISSFWILFAFVLGTFFCLQLSMTIFGFLTTMHEDVVLTVWKMVFDPAIGIFNLLFVSLPFPIRFTPNSSYFEFVTTFFHVFTFRRIYSFHSCTFSSYPSLFGCLYSLREQQKLLVQNRLWCYLPSFFSFFAQFACHLQIHWELIFTLSINYSVKLITRYHCWSLTICPLSFALSQFFSFHSIHSDAVTICMPCLWYSHFHSTTSQFDWASFSDSHFFFLNLSLCLSFYFNGFFSLFLHKADLFDLVYSIWAFPLFIAVSLK